MQTLRPPHKSHRGQSLVEFALVMPLLLFLCLMIFDFAHLMVAHASSSSALRRALRNAEVVGFANAPVPNYVDCERILSDAVNTVFVSNHEVTIEYLMHDPLANDWRVETCDTISADDLEFGDLLSVTLSAQVRILNPFINGWLDQLTFTFQGQRTILKSIELPFDLDSSF